MLDVNWCCIGDGAARVAQRRRCREGIAAKTTLFASHCQTVSIFTWLAVAITGMRSTGSVDGA